MSYILSICNGNGNSSGSGDGDGNGDSNKMNSLTRAVQRAIEFPNYQLKEGKSQKGCLVSSKTLQAYLANQFSTRLS